MKRSAPMRRSAGAFLDRFLAFASGLICLAFAATLFDARLLPAPPLTPAPPVPASDEARDAEVTVVVVDEADGPIAGASVRVFVMRDKKAYFAGDSLTDEAGRATLTALPRGEAWVLAYAAERARVSKKVSLRRDAGEERLVLRRAVALDVAVIDEGERPIGGADVRVQADDPLPFVARTDKDGRARIDRLPPAAVVARASALGYEDSVRTAVPPTVAPLRFRLAELGTLEVTVVDRDAVPAAGATVLAGGSGLWPARTTLTDERGKARVTGLRAGVYELKARLEDEVSRTEMAVPLKRGETKEVTLTLEAGRSVEVRVTDGEADGAPVISGAGVVLVEGGLSPFPLQGLTDKDGKVVLGPISLEGATVSARAEGFVSRSAVVVGELETEARVSLLRGGTLVGDVVDDRGYPVDGATIEVVGVDLDGMPINETTSLATLSAEHFAFALAGPSPLMPAGELGVMPGRIPDLPHEAWAGFSSQGGPADPALGDAPPAGRDPWVTRGDGTFRVGPVAPGRMHLIVRHPSYVETVSDTVTLQSGKEATISVVMRRGGTLEGRVLDADKRPLAGARVELAATRGSLERVTYSADDGAFAFAAVPDEVLVSVARPESPSDVVTRLVVEVQPGERETIDIVLPAVRGAIALHVVDDRDYPLGRVEVRVVALDAEVPLRTTLFTNDDGDTSLADAEGLPLRLTLSRAGKAPRVVDVERAPKELEIKLDPSVSARGVVTARDGRDRVEGASVVLYTRTGARHAKTDAEGAFTLSDLSPGRVRIAVSDETHAPREVIDVVGEDPERPTEFGAIDLPEAGEAVGEVVDDRGDPVPGARVAVGGVPTYLPLGPLPMGIVATDAEGRFTLGGIAEGSVTLEAYSADLGRGWADVAVRAGRTVSRVRIELAGSPSSREPKGAGSVAVTLGERSGKVIVVMVPPASEAELAGIEPGDELVSVNGKAARTMGESRRLLSGPLSEDVIVEIFRSDDGTKGGAPRKWLTRVRRERVRR